MLSNNIAVLLNDGIGGFGGLPTLYAAGGDYPANVVAADVNGDGNADIITANGLSDDVSVLLNNGSGVFDAAVAYDVGADFPIDVSVADVNGDGFADIVTASGNSDNVSVLLGNGSGGFAAPILYGAGGDGTYHSALADVNGDGRIDIVTTNSLSNDLSVLLNTDGDPTVNGTLTASDVDNGDTQTWSIQGSDTGTYGSLALDGNSGEWTYTLANASEAVQSLAAGESDDETFTVRVTDSQGAYAEQIVTVTVTGVDDFSFFSLASGYDAGADTTDDSNGADTIYFDSAALGSVDTISSLAIGDVVDLTDVFTVNASGGGDIMDYVDVSASQLLVDADGSENGSNFVALANLPGEMLSVSIVYDDDLASTDMTAVIS